MTEMIAAEPALAERLIHRLTDDEAVARLAAAVRECVAAGRPVLTTGCGTSEHAAQAVATLLSDALDLPTGREVRAVAALDLANRPVADALLIAVSHEGGTAITNEALRRARAARARTALLTVGGGSPGADLAELVIATGEQDQSWCHTVGYLSPILAGVVIAARLVGARVDALAIRALLDAAADPQAAAGIASALAGSDRLIVVGAGVDLLSARELALKVAEGARMPAMALELETVLHGHLAAASRWTGLVLVATASGPGDGPVAERTARVTAAARSLGVPVGAILSAEMAGALAADQTPAGRIVLAHIGRVSAPAGSLLGSAVALQLLTERLARARGVNPDTLGREDPAQAAAHG